MTSRERLSTAESPSPRTADRRTSIEGTRAGLPWLCELPRVVRCDTCHAAAPDGTQPIGRRPAGSVSAEELPGWDVTGSRHYCLRCRVRRECAAAAGHDWGPWTTLVFGPEPSDVELYQFLLTEGGALIDVALKTPWVEGSLGVRWPRNPKRTQRQVSREAALPTTSTAAQQALRYATEQRAAERKKLARQRKADQCEDAYRKRRQRAKAKHRGH